jgi:hypothetical protein
VAILVVVVVVVLITSSREDGKEKRLQRDLGEESKERAQRERGRG